DETPSVRRGHVARRASARRARALRAARDRDLGVADRRVDRPDQGDPGGLGASRTAGASNEQHRARPPRTSYGARSRRCTSRIVSILSPSLLTAATLPAANVASATTPPSAANVACTIPPGIGKTLAAPVRSWSTAGGTVRV